MTIQTSPDEAQHVIDQIKALQSGATPDWNLFDSNCTTVCEDVLSDLGMDFGDIHPNSFWTDAFYKFNADARAHPFWARLVGAGHLAGIEYGNPRNFGVGTPFPQWILELYMNQQEEQPEACVEAHDSSGQGTGTHCE